MLRALTASVFAGLVLAISGWLVWSRFPDSSQEAVANLAKAQDFFGVAGGAGFWSWWSPNFLGGASLAPHWGTAVTLGWLIFWSSLLGATAGVKVALLACIPLAAATMFLFLWKFTRREGLSLLGAVAYAMAPSLWMRVLDVEHVVVAMAMAVLPLACLGVYRLTRKPTTFSALACAAGCSLLALTYSKAALLVAPVLLAFALWGIWRGCGLAPLLRAKVLFPLLGGLFVLGILPNLPALREAGFAALFEFGPLEGWRNAFSTKTAMQLADRLGILSGGFRQDLAPTTAAGGVYVGLVPLALLVAVLLWHRRLLHGPLAAHFRVTCGLALFAFWLSFGPFSVFSGTLRALEASASAADFFPALLWLSLVAQGWVLWNLLPPEMPLRKAFAILLMAIYFLVPGFGVVSWLPIYADIRAPFDFYQVGGVVWTCAAVAVAASLLYAASPPSLLRLVLLGLCAGIWGLDFAGHLTIPAKRALSTQTRLDFESAAAFLREAPQPGSIWAVSGRYFYLRLPELTGRPIIQEAFQSYLQQRGYAMLQGAASYSPADIVDYLRIAGVGYVLLDLEDPDLPPDLPKELDERLPEVYKNRGFQIFEVRPSLAPAFVARDAVLLGKDDPADVLASLGVAAADFAAIGPVLPGRSAGTIEKGELELSGDFRGRVGKPFEVLPQGSLQRSAPGRIVVTVPRGEGWLIVPEAWHPDWKVDGMPAYMAFGAFLAAPCPEAGGAVAFEFRPPVWYAPAIWFSLAGWVCVVGGLPLLKGRLDAWQEAASWQTEREEVRRPLVISPTYNEAASLPQLLDRVFAADTNVHVLVVDDASPDGTAAIVRAHPLYEVRLFLLERSGKLGLGSAYREGFRWAETHGYDACVEIDADLSHDPSDIPRLLAALNDGADAAIGSRYLDGLRVVNWPEERLLISSVATQFVRFVTGLPLTDATSGFKALRCGALQRLDWRDIRAEGYGFQVELHHALWKAGAVMVEVPITFTERREGKTKMTSGIAVEAMGRVLELGLGERGMSWRREHRAELISGTAAGALSMAIYAWTAAPNVTLLDSGEFIVAAQHFGVPHPTGYPLWTLLAWLFQLLPLGNAAWEIALFSGVCGALAVGICAGMLTNLLRWFLEERLEGRGRLLPPLIGFAFAMLLAVSTSMWSQATIAEVYTLHALMVAIYLALLYGWVRHPARDGLLLWAFFVLALSFSNHHLSLTLAPLPLLLVLLLRRRALADWIFAGAVTLVPGYLGFAILSEDLAVLKTAIRLFFVVAVAGIIFVLVRRFRVRWKLVAFLPLAVAAGLLPYLYMPFASSTNPPMNWAYTREARGFFYSINRSQYGGALSDQSLRLAGRLLGTKALSKQAQQPAEASPNEPGRLESARDWVGFFWQQMASAFTPFAVLGYFASIFFILRAPLAQRTWIYLLHLGFVLAAFLQPMLDGATTDAAGWWLQMPYHTYTNLIFTLLSGLGWGLLLAKLMERRAIYFWLAPATLLLPLWTAPGSEAASSQRNRWFGWMYGRDMLADLPPGSIVIGGTDPGRFVPTYMIFGESPQSPKIKRDPNFDRRDLYIITQNALGEEFYMKYLRDHYGKDRPVARNAFERWLGRDEMYPKKPLKMPSPEEVDAAIKNAIVPDPQTGKRLEEDPSMAPFSGVLHWLWEHNKAEHPFFVEESFPIKWTYDYAEPHGLVYRLHPEKLERLPEESIRKDFSFWDEYVQKLMADPEFVQDFDARRSFSKLRLTGANLYLHRGLKKEAERAYRQSLTLFPASIETLVGYVQLLWEDKRYDEADKILEAAYKLDPNSRGIVQLAISTQARRELGGQVDDLEAKAGKGDADALAKVLGILVSIAETNRAKGVVEKMLAKHSTNKDVMLVVANFTGLERMDDDHLKATESLAVLRPDDPQPQYLLARARMVVGETNAALKAAQRAIELGGRRMREQIRTDELFRGVLTNELFRLTPASPPRTEEMAEP